MFRKHTLKNGLTIVSELREQSKSVGIGLFVRTGARDEDPSISGMSHFLEHMMFKGTAKRSAMQLSYDLGSIGAQANAYTSNESTVYYMSLLSENLEPGMDILTDMLQPSLDHQEFEMERQVILEEIALYQDRPIHVLLEAAASQYFGEHPLGKSILGPSEIIAAVTQPQMRDYFSHRYTTQNMVFAVCGNFDFDTICQFLEERTRDWSSRTADREYPAIEQEPSAIELTRDTIEKAYYCTVAPGPDAAHTKRYAAKVLSTIIGDSTGSKLYWELVDKGLADSAICEVDLMDRTGVVYGYACSEPSQIEEVIAKLNAVLRQPADFSEEELSRSKTKLCTEVILHTESNSRRMMSIGNEWLYTGTYRSADDIVAAVMEVSRTDIEELLEEFPWQPQTQVTLIPTTK